MFSSKAGTYTRMALELSELSTCLRRKVGCLIFDEYDRIIGSGYNGVARGQAHCDETNCVGKSGVEFLYCNAIHAEQNALMHCNDILSINTIITTSSPCIHCAKMIANTSCVRLIYVDEYKDPAGKMFLWSKMTVFQISRKEVKWLR